MVTYCEEHRNYDAKHGTPTTVTKRYTLETKETACTKAGTGHPCYHIAGIMGTINELFLSMNWPLTTSSHNLDSFTTTRGREAPPFPNEHFSRLPKLKDTGCGFSVRASHKCQPKPATHRFHLSVERPLGLCKHASSTTM